MSWSRSGSILVLFLGLLSLGGLGPFLSLGVVFWFRFHSGLILFLVWFYSLALVLGVRVLVLFIVPFVS